MGEGGVGLVGDLLNEGLRDETIIRGLAMGKYKVMGPTKNGTRQVK